jgi:hypothetical protein
MSGALLDPAIVCWQCDDPALNYRVELTELVQHTLILGSTGSGKSTLLIDATRQLIAHQAQSPKDKIGLLILDAKADDLVARVQEAALRAGRASDVLVFGPSGDCGMDLFGALQGQAGGSGTDPSGPLSLRLGDIVFAYIHNLLIINDLGCTFSLAPPLTWGCKRLSTTFPIIGSSDEFDPGLV